MRVLGCRRARRYKVQKQLGDGTYGSVWKAINRQTNEVVSGAHPRTSSLRAFASVGVSVVRRHPMTHVCFATQKPRGGVSPAPTALFFIEGRELD